MNLKGFPPFILRPLGVTAWHPDDFICGLPDRPPAAVAGAVRDQRRCLRNPPVLVGDLLDTLAAQGLPRIAERLRIVASDLE